MGTRAIARTRRIYVQRPKSRRRSQGMTVPVAVLAGFAPLAVNTWAGYQNGGVSEAGRRALKGLSGFDYINGELSPSYALRWGMGPIIGGLLVHKLAGRLGINRMLARSGVPFLRV